MAFNKIFSVTVIFFLVGRVAAGAIAPESGYDEGISPVSSFEGEPAPEPSLYGELPPEPEPSPEQQEFFITCTKKITGKCGDTIFSNIFLNESNPVTENCCGKLLLAGRQCHDGLVKFIASTPQFKGNASITVPRSVEAWNKCVLVAGDVSPSPSP